ncbi:glycosyltransferase family 71 protein [Xylona heveae TC161]|uniref:Glycosyltransferase family 71 protein n=1 Tax=Xylona heveae (strain CBS 132557 / TC161) TaxID=1328760 RepID=A0A165GFN0_XYLHT|nr:glycosyltransferase family 71 protein [Xylona heveae TC161]KZF22126.1 glycosyltransferase family 71 protein [Xylona heveae TC161]
MLAFKSPSHFGRRDQRLRCLIPIACVILFLFIYVGPGIDPVKPTLVRLESWHSNVTRTPQDFWDEFVVILAAARPQVHGPRGVDPWVPARADRFNWDQADEVTQQDQMSLGDDELESLRMGHSWLVEKIQQGKVQLPYVKGSRGIVYSAGGHYLAIMMVSLMMLRDTGSELPVEVFLNSDSEYDPIICDQVLPTFNAKCILLSDILESSKLRLTFSHYQLKIFAVLFSSFEEMLFLDADNFPVRLPDDLFESPEFKQDGLILWPDYWICTTSSHFYTIAGLPPSASRRYPTTEAGQMVISKSRHADTLLLSGFYNAYGDDYYYPLLSQGGPGQGDKETFPAAARALNHSYYAVHTLPQPLGRASGDFQGWAVLQYNPSDDCLDNNAHCNPPRPFFVHVGWGNKLNPFRQDERDYRIFGSEEFLRHLFGKDLEKLAYQKMIHVACEKRFFFHNVENPGDACQRLKRIYEAVFKSTYEPNTIAAAPQKSS